MELIEPKAPLLVHGCWGALYKYLNTIQYKTIIMLDTLHCRLDFLSCFKLTWFTIADRVRLHTTCATCIFTSRLLFTSLATADLICIAPVNKQVSLTWLLWALRSFLRLHYITLHYIPWTLHCLCEEEAARERTDHPSSLPEVEGTKLLQSFKPTTASGGWL